MRRWVLGTAFLSMAASAGTLSVVRPRCEAMREAVGVASVQPRFTWAFEGDENPRAAKAQVRVCEWTGESEDLFSLTYAGPALEPGRPYFWQTRLADANGVGVTDWCAPQRFVVALQKRDQWQGARWIGESTDTTPRFGDGMLKLKFKVLKGELEAIVRARPDGSGGCSIRVGKGLVSGSWHELQIVAAGERVEAKLDGKSVGTYDKVAATGTFGVRCGAEDDTRVRRIAWVDTKTWQEVIWDEFTGHRQAAFFNTDRDNDGLVVRNRRYLHPGLQPKNCPRFRKTFGLKPGEIAWATASVCGKGLYEFWMNGVKADPRRMLAPANLSRRGLAFDTYDVTELVKPGVRNTVGLWLAPGYSDDFSRYGAIWAGPKRTILHLAIGYADGSRETIVTDGSWEWTPKSPITYASIYHGERYDASLEDPKWCTPEGTREGWLAVKTLPDNCGNLLANSTPPVRLGEPLKPIRITEPKPGVFVADFGQNRAGVVELRVKGPKGTKIRLHTSEIMGKDGMIDPWTNRAAQSLDEFTLAGTGAVERYLPRFTYHGFHYVEITGWPGRPTAEDLTAWAVHADLERTATFECSDPTLMKLFNAATWSMLSNFMNNPTDCPMRDERTPCAMDSQAHEDAACQFFDMERYYEKWLDDQGVGGPDPDWCGDAQTLIMRQWRHYGNRRQLAARYGDLKTAVEKVYARFPDGYCKDGFGDWVAPNDGTWNGYHNDVALVNTALFATMISNVVEAAEALGNGKDRATYAVKYEAQKRLFETRFRNPGEVTYGDRSQATSVLPLAFGLVPEADRKAVLAQLVERITGKDRTRFDTGIFGTRYIGDVLLDEGEWNLFLGLFTQREFPSFGFMFENGGTTLWEQWTVKCGMNSHNHAMFSGGASCLLSHLAGIRAEKPGYRELLIKPAFPDGLDHLTATRVTPYGTVRVAWRRMNGKVRIQVNTPPYVKARIEVPKNVVVDK